MNGDSRDIGQTKKIIEQENYVGKAMQAHGQFWQRLDLDYLAMTSEPDKMMHIEYHVTLHNHVLEGSIYTNKLQNKMISKLKSAGINTLGDIRFERHKTEKNHQLYHSFPIHWRKMLNKSKKDYRYKDLEKKETDKLIFRSKVKWTEEGEKSNKYFFNLIKHNQAKTVIRKLKVNGKTFIKQD